MQFLARSFLLEFEIRVKLSLHSPLANLRASTRNQETIIRISSYNSYYVQCWLSIPSLSYSFSTPYAVIGRANNHRSLYLLVLTHTSWPPRHSPSPTPTPSPSSPSTTPQCTFGFVNSVAENTLWKSIWTLTFFAAATKSFFVLAFLYRMRVRLSIIVLSAGIGNCNASI